MPNVYPSHLETPLSSTDVEAEVLFVDLDETILDGTVSRLTDGELEKTQLIDETIRKMEQARALSIPIVMVTRNNDEAIGRFFEAYPEMRVFFSETLAVENRRKSEAIDYYLRRTELSVKKAAFIDDTAGERDDVERYVDGIRSSHPNETFNITAAKTDAVQEERKKLLERFKNTPYPKERKQIKNILESRFQMKTHEINLAA